MEPLQSKTAYFSLQTLAGFFIALMSQQENLIGHTTWLAASWGSPLIVDGKVYIGDEDGDVCIFKLAKEMDLVAEINMGNSVYTTPIIANGTLYIANRSHLFAIKEGAKPRTESS